MKALSANTPRQSTRVPPDLTTGEPATPEVSHTQQATNQGTRPILTPDATAVFCFNEQTPHATQDVSVQVDFGREERPPVSWI